MSCHFLTISSLRSALPIQDVNIHKAIGIGGTIVYFLNRRGGTNLQDEYSNNWEFADFLGGSPGVTYWRSYNGEEHFDPASPIHLDISYLKSSSKRKQKYWVLQRNDTFKIKITLDRHNARLELNCWHLSDPPHFSLPSTLNFLL